MKQLDREQATEWASWFQAIADPSRILILHLLSTEQRAMTVGEITDRLDIGQSTVSHHLAKLADVRFVLVDRVGTASYFRANEACLVEFPSAAQLVMGQVPEAFTRAREAIL